MLIYMLTGNDMAEISFVKQQLDLTFTIKDRGPLKYFLGM
ncbi:hypothetical protein LINGRAPRIM_LOCUS134, partial [Linum grandiflorum]